MVFIIRLILLVQSFGKFGSAGFFPLPVWLRGYFNIHTKLWRLQVYSRLVNGVSFWKQAPPELACAESVTTIGHILFGMPVMLSTLRLLQYFIRNKKWMEMSYPVNGCIVLAATTTGYPGTIGHVGTYDKGKVWSNNSNTGRWSDFYTLDTFRKRYERKQGMPVRYFIPLED